MPSEKRGSPSLVILAEGLTLLIDSGPGALRQLARAGLSYKNLDFLLYTHFHPDHIADLVAYLFAMRYWPGSDRTEPALVYGPTGLQAMTGHLQSAYGHWIQPPENRVTMAELPSGTRHGFRCGSIQVESMPVPHTSASLGYKLTTRNGRTLVVAGDTGYGPQLIDLARKADLLIMECSFPEEIFVEGHMNSSLAGKAAAEAEVKTLAMTHFYPETEGHDLVADVKKQFTGEVILAEDLMKISL
ncbi:MAG: ribonuclease Z [Deltaproteobacteria bacterium]|nr:ribonuclease Z [Deltaproteobacteria bacterium]